MPSSPEPGGTSPSSSSPRQSHGSPPPYQQTGTPLTSPSHQQQPEDSPRYDKNSPECHQTESPVTSPRRELLSSPNISPLSDSSFELRRHVVSPSSSVTASPPTSPFGHGAASPTSSPRCPPQKRFRQSEEVSRATLQRRLHEHDDSDEDLDENSCPPGEFQTQQAHALNYAMQMLSDTSDTDSGPDVAFSSDSELEIAADKGAEDASIGTNDNVFDNIFSDVDSPHLSEIGESDDENFDEDIDDENSQLYDGSNISTNEGILKILKQYLKARWTKTSLNENLKLIKSLLPKPNQLPPSSHSLFKKLQHLSPFIKEKKYFYCSNCQDLMTENKTCAVCGTQDFGVFYEFPLEPQIQYLFEQCRLASFIDHHKANRKKEDGHICDVLDGAEYQKIRLNLTGRYDIVLIFNSDGVSLSKSSKQQLWGIMCSICEVSPQVRPNFMIICGVYVDNCKPKMNVFLKPFVNSLKNIYQKGGVIWTDPISKIQHKSQVVAPILSADAPARAILLNVKQYNARFGCNCCEQKAQKVKKAAHENEQGRSSRRFVFQEEPAPLRSGDRMNLQGQLAELRNKSRKGVIGNAIASEIPLLDRAVCVASEYLHTVLLGVVKYFLDISINKRGPYYIGNHIEEIDNFILSIKVPDFIKRLPRRLSDFKLYKGSEFRSFLLFYCLPTFVHFMPENYLQHWLLLVQGIYLLLSDSISADDLSVADTMLRCFVRDVHVLYGDECYTFNVHNLLHLALLVSRWGPLYCTSAFDFEKLNGFITSHLHGTKHFGKELLNNLQLMQSVRTLENIVGLEKVELSGTETQFSEIQLLGAPLINFSLSAEMKQALSLSNIENFSLYGRIKVGPEVFTSHHYDKLKKRSNSYIRFVSRVPNKSYEYGQILVFVKPNNVINDKTLCLVKVFKIQHLNLFFHIQSRYKVSHLLPVQESSEVALILTSNIVTKLIKAGNYLCQTKPI